MVDVVDYRDRCLSRACELSGTFGNIAGSYMGLRIAFLCIDDIRYLEVQS